MPKKAKADPAGHDDINSNAVQGMDAIESSGWSFTWSAIIPGLPTDPSQMDFIRIVRSGIPASAILKLAESSGIPIEVIFAAIHYDGDVENILNVLESAQLVGVGLVFSNALKIFGTLDEARNWLMSPSYALKEVVPITLLDTPLGIDVVHATLMRIKYGMIEME